VARGTFAAPDEVTVTPRLSGTPGDPTAASPAWPGADTDAVLAEHDFDDAEIAALRAAGAIA
jgi:crotonobetainyl-CoA:carnitine CoA-transferase CaiB-like acyl-CoA transferase